ncbi:MULTISPECIES: Crp/Fnr family transcriptional regulator [Sphingobium]|uniref:Crp/Fnr family transcriptional regulator n=1 Tax=Sphingobium TaxID=165695 RepID=UPI001BE4FBCB|nr:Crp/Fnr family transcriptional regulator [Sphingobium yanoikuyae]MBT2245035.1 Crp/Fnr family transcriptional regulator [Sphingobium sp. BHU LFT2]WBQ19394.1 Crp/Fnr family transcriptional regulator [Sphingobium yanoikuyae]
MQIRSVSEPFFTKLQHGASLTLNDKQILADLCKHVRDVKSQRDIASQDRACRYLPIILEGWACRYRLLENGKRQITGLFIPGDLCEPFGILPRFPDSTFAALTPTKIALASLDAVAAAARSSPSLREAFWWDLLMASSIDQERLVSLGRRSAAERVAHLFCELHVRLMIIGQADNEGYELLITQTDMSDMLGLTSVHVNRSLKILRETGLISLKGRRLMIHDLVGLRDLALFDPTYLHLDRSTSRSPATVEAEGAQGYEVGT